MFRAIQQEQKRTKHRRDTTSFGGSWSLISTTEKLVCGIQSWLSCLVMHILEQVVVQMVWFKRNGHDTPSILHPQQELPCPFNWQLCCRSTLNMFFGTSCSDNNGNELVFQSCAPSKHFGCIVWGPSPNSGCQKCWAKETPNIGPKNCS
jgi:hypothetical protein